MDDILTAEQAAILSLLTRVEGLERECRSLRLRLGQGARMQPCRAEFALPAALRSRPAPDRETRMELHLARAVGVQNG